MRFVYIILSLWVEVGRNYLERSMIAQVIFKIIKILLGLMEIIFMKNFYQQMLLILRSILLGNTICMLRREDHLHLMGSSKEILMENN